MFTPIVLALGKNLPFLPQGTNLLRCLLLTGAPVIPVIVAFNEGTGSDISFPLAFLPFPILLWSALSLGVPGTALSAAFVTTIATAYTVMGRGPFIHPDPLETYGNLAVYILVITTTNLFMA